MTAAALRVDVVTIFPEYLAPLSVSLLGKAAAAGVLDVRVHDLRGWTTDRHRTVDDSPYGGGPGMVMKPEPWGDTFDALLAEGPPPVVVVPTPSGARFTQDVAQDLAGRGRLLIACGRYEGIDAGCSTTWPRGWRCASCRWATTCSRAARPRPSCSSRRSPASSPGCSATPSPWPTTPSPRAPCPACSKDRCSTKPASWRGRSVPEVLVSGDHAAIARWRRDQALRRTAALRPDLVARLDPARLDPPDLAVLSGLGWQPAPDGGFEQLPGPVAD